MRHFRAIFIIGSIEILIGVVTIFINFVTIMMNANTKSPKVLLFVTVAATISTLLGIGMLKFVKLAYRALLYFSSVIILTKFLIFMDVISLNGALETTVPGPLKSIISIGYHGCVIYYLRKPEIKKHFT